MEKCKNCGADMVLTSFDSKGGESWQCFNECELEKGIKRVQEFENSISYEERLRDYHESLNRFLAELHKKTSHCWWTSRPDRTRCPGIVVRTEETRDGPYGNFCPVCGYSLRYHYRYGEGKWDDLAKRFVYL